MLIAKVEILEDQQIPEGVRRYFADYAKEMDLFGMKVLTISQRLFWSWEDGVAYNEKQKGIGPGHSVDLARYEKWMPMKGDYPMSVNTWIYEYQRHGGKKIVTLTEVGERHEIHWADDD